MPRLRMSCLLSSSSRPLLSYLIAAARQIGVQGVVVRNAEATFCSAFFMFCHSSARLLAGPPAGFPVSSSGGGSIGLTPKLTAADDAAS